MTRVLLTGSNGFVAQKFCELFDKDEHQATLLGLSKSSNRNPYLQPSTFKQVDLTDFDSLKQILKDFAPTHILHTAAITSVEACENEKKLAQKVNIDLTTLLGQYAKDNNCHLTFLSTDFVFDGKNGPYTETDSVAAVNFYGESKIEAEKQLLALNSDIAILRTILVYGAIPDKGRSNLVLWAKGQLEQQKPIKVVSDQWRMPTWVDDLAQACISAILLRAKGVYHISGEEMMTIEEAVLTLADTWNFDKSLISSISAKEIGQENNRPRKTGFILDKAKTELDYRPTPFIVSLRQIKEQLEKY